MSSERRKNKRVRLSLATYWCSETSRHAGVIRDLSKNGCFVMASEQVNKGMAVELELKLPSVFHMTVQGSIVHTLHNVGFAVSFKELKVTERLLLERLLAHHQS